MVHHAHSGSLREGTMGERRTIYLDHAATTPVKPAVMDAMRPYYTEHFGNPSSIYGIARESKNASFAASSGNEAMVPRRRVTLHIPSYPVILSRIITLTK